MTVSSRALQDQQFEIDDVTFGGAEDGVKLDGFDPGQAAVEDQDSLNPQSGGRQFGRTILRGPLWSFNMVTDGGVTGGFAAASDAAERLALAWRQPIIHGPPDRLQPLRYNLGGRTRRVYGQGRKFDMGVAPLSFSGTAPLDATFQLWGNGYFDDVLSQVEIPIVPPTSGGLVAPLLAPLTTGGATVWRTGACVVGGTIPTPATITFHGPISAPWVRGRGFYLKYDFGLASDQTLTVETMNHLHAFDNFGRNLTSKLSPQTRMGNAMLRPGAEFVTFGGSDITGTARAIVSWRNAYTIL